MRNFRQKNRRSKAGLKGDIMSVNASQTHTSHAGPAAATVPELTPEDASKDRFYSEVANIGNAMVAQHGNEFAMGVFVLAARFIAEGKALSQPAPQSESCGAGCTDHHHHHKT